jgi:hypothetical protein
MFKAISTSSSNAKGGNYIDAFQLSCDGDGDDSSDGLDDYPNDPTRTYRSYFPSSGH